jgi:Zn-dependent membrane protease YugP
MFMPYYNPYFWLSIPVLLFAMWAQFKVMSTFRKYSQVPAGSGVTGAEAAMRLLDHAGLGNVVKVEAVQGTLSDHYDPRNKVLRLSPEVYGSASVAALGVAAHEVGHAIQDKERYAPLVLRNAIVPVAGLGSNLGIILFIVGSALGRGGGWIMDLGILLFVGVVAFTVITLPTEFDASNRALRQLQGLGLVTPRELDGSKAVLGAAALTYVAAAAQAIIQLLQLFLMRNANREE